VAAWYWPAAHDRHAVGPPDALSDSFHPGRALLDASADHVMVAPAVTATPDGAWLPEYSTEFTVNLSAPLSVEKNVTTSVPARPTVTVHVCDGP